MRDFKMPRTGSLILCGPQTSREINLERKTCSLHRLASAAGGIVPTVLFPEPPPPSGVASRATAAPRPAISGLRPWSSYLYISLSSLFLFL